MPASLSRKTPSTPPSPQFAPPRAYEEEADFTTAKTGRKKSKNALPKEAILGRETDSNEQSERDESPNPAPIAEAVEGGLRPFSKFDFGPSPILEDLDASRADFAPTLSAFAGVWQDPISKSPPAEQPGIQHGSSPSFGDVLPSEGGFSSKTPPASPPMRKVRPASFGAGRVPSHTHSSPRGTVYGNTSSPPPPHLPQAHFYGAPEVDVPVPQYQEAEAGPRILSFAKIPSHNSKRFRRSSEMVLSAQEGRVDILAVDRNKLSPVGALCGIGGQPVAAKVLTWETGPDPYANLRPLVAVVVHGPKLEEPGSMDSVAELRQSETPAKLPRSNESTEYQTTVRVYSLATQRHVATLLWSKPSLGLPNVRGLPASVPPPAGQFTLDARGNFWTVSSGTSGEIWIFGIGDEPRFSCVGKLWTSLQSLPDRRRSSDSSSNDADTSPADPSRGMAISRTPILSLSGRWLAIVPPGPTSSQPLPVTVLQCGPAPGLESRNAPPVPSPSCTVDSPDVESLLNRVARGVAQEVVRGARWLGGQGMQAWNSYLSKDQPNMPGPPNRSYQGEHFPPGVFPPTHAELRPSSEPQLVSVIDLEGFAGGSKVPGSEYLAPLATFQPPGGIGFLSFSPDGINIFSSTKKGDVQYVWDLKQLRYLRASSRLTLVESDPTASGKVIQVARFARVTPSSIVDIDWRSPLGASFALVTKNGTIHIFDLPPSAYQWPPMRRHPRQEPVSAPATPAMAAQSDDTTVVGSVFSSAMKLASRTQPILANLRGRTVSIGGSGQTGLHTGIGIASATGIRGSRAVVTGLSKSVGAATGTVHSLRHAGDNRLHIVSLARDPARSRVIWTRSGKKTALLVLDGQSLRSYHVSTRRPKARPARSLSVIDPNAKLHLQIPTSLPAPTLARTASPERASEETRGFWALPSSSGERASRFVPPLSQAEIDSNAPYQPFHSDRRVTLSVFSDEYAAGGPNDARTPWAFGENIPVNKLHIRSPPQSDDEDPNDGGSMLYRHMATTNRNPSTAEGMAEQVVVTTRRRKQKKARQAGQPDGTPDNDDGFFEDDCDVLDFTEDRV